MLKIAKRQTMISVKLPGHPTVRNFVCMYCTVVWKDERYKEDGSTTQFTLPPSFKTKKLRTQPSTEISICAHDTFCFRPLSCGGHFDLYPTPSLLRSFGKRRDVTIWKKPRASGAAAPLPPPILPRGWRGPLVALGPQSPAHQKHNIPCPRFIIM